MSREEALAAVERQRGALVRWMVRQCGSYAEAQDVAAEVVALAAEAALPESPAALRLWVRTRAETVARRVRRRRQRQRETLGSRRSLEQPIGQGELTYEDIVADGTRGIDAAVCARAVCRHVLEALESWPRAERELLLAAAAGATHEELAARSGSNRDQTRRRLALLRRRLLAALDADTAAELGEFIDLRATP